MLDPRGNVLVINDQAKAMFHVPAEREVHGASVLEISRHPNIRLILDEVLKFDFTSQTFSKEVELEDGNWFSVNAVPLRNAQHMTLGLDSGVSRCRRNQTARNDSL